MATYEPTIEEIHGAIDTAGEHCLFEATKILLGMDATFGQISEQELADIKLLELEAVGFRSPQIREAKIRIKEREAARKTIRDVQYYATKYPRMKFVPKDALRDICRQYGLIIGLPGDFIGKMPLANVDEMIQNKVDPRDSLGNVYVLGTPDVFNLDGMYIDHNYQIRKDVRPPKDDPAILEEVEGGYLVRTVWGDEANIPALNFRL